MFIDYGHAFLPHMHIGADHDGLETMRFVEHHLDELREEYGVTSFDLVVPTHIHDDHTCGIPYLQRHHGTRMLGPGEVAQVLADPAAWASTPCTFPKPIRIDRWLKDGETLPLGGVRVRDPLRPRPDRVPLGLRRADRRPQGGVHRRQLLPGQRWRPAARSNMLPYPDDGAAQQLPAGDAPPLRRGDARDLRRS